MSTFSLKIEEEKDYELAKELQSTDFKKSIQKYFKMKNLINAAADSVLREKKNIYQMAQTQGIPYSLLRQKINIMNLSELYLIKKCKYEAAVKSVLSENSLLKCASVIYDVKTRTLLEEIVRFSNSEEKTYEFDGYCDPFMPIFTFKEELSLLNSVELWKTEGNPLCSCEICSMEKLMLIAYQSAQERKLRYPRTWDIEKRASVGWLISLDMVHSTLISKLASRNECFRFPELRSKPDLFDGKIDVNSLSICARKKLNISSYRILRRERLLDG